MFGERRDCTGIALAHPHEGIQFDFFLSFLVRFLSIQTLERHCSEVLAR